jgi:hypothetical protein
MPNRILVLHDQLSVGKAVLRALHERGFSGSVFRTVDEVLDDLCDGGAASVILYDGERSETPWLFARAQEANPALSRVPLIAISPLVEGGRRAAPLTRTASLDLEALLLIVGQLCRSESPGPSRQVSREP